MQQSVIQKLRVIFKATQAHSKLVEKSCGMSSAKLWMLHEVEQADGIKVSQLAKVLSVHPSTCSNMLDKLEENNLIYRDRSKTDQRTVHLHVTSKGKGFLEKAPKPLQGKLSGAISELSFAQISALDKELTGLVSALNIPGDKGAFTMTPITD
ncbi:MAG: MarR family transcriptional regulator [Desulfotalea sp.]